MRTSLLLLATLAASLLACGGRTDDSNADSGVGCQSCSDGGSDVTLDTGRGDTNDRADTVGDASTETTTDASDTPGDASSPGAEPPPRPSTTTSGGATKWLVVDKLYLGLSNRTTGALSADAWKDYGFDLDDRTTTTTDSKTSANSCHRVAGSPTGILVDGSDGRDNNFGGHFMQTMKSLKSDVEDAVNSAIASGGATLLLRLDNVAGDDNGSVPGALFVTGQLSTAPKFDGTDLYPVDTSSVTGGDLSKPIVTFAGGYMAGGVWVSGDVADGRVDLPIAVSGAVLTIPMQGGVLVVRVADGKDGTIAGLMRASDTEPTFRPFFEGFGVCHGTPTYDAVVSTINESVDLVAGAPSFQDTTIDCDSISIGVGFDVAPVTPPTTVVPSPPPPTSTCP